MEQVTYQAMQKDRFKLIWPFLLVLRKYAIHALVFSFHKGLRIVHFVVRIVSVAVNIIHKD
jgi:hypothetical protein